MQGAVLGGSRGGGITQMWSGWRGEHWSWSLSPDTASLQQEFSGSSPKRRRAEDKDEGIGSPDIWEDEKAEDLRREMIELRQQLDKERSVRMMLEEQVRPCGAGFGCGAVVCGTAVAGHGVGSPSSRMCPWLCWSLLWTLALPWCDGPSARATLAPHLAMGSPALLCLAHEDPAWWELGGAVPGAGWAPHRCVGALLAGRFAPWRPTCTPRS